MATTVDLEDMKLDEQNMPTTITSHQNGEMADTENQLKREFKPRQVFMFSIACAIGTGLVIGSGTGLSRGGPGSLLISYIMVGVAVFFVMTSLGEMAAFVPMNKGFAGYASRMVDPAFGFATGWNYFFKYMIAAPANLTAAGLVIQYWRPDLNVAIWVAVFGVAIITINVLHVSMIGETEFWLGATKILVLIILIISCLVVALGGGPNHVRTGFHYWSDPGAFKEYLAVGSLGRFLGFWACVCQACFAYVGTEVVGMTFGETPNPRKNIPRAVKQTFWRIAVFYILAVVVLGMAVPSDNELLIGATKKSTSADASPFVVAVRLAGIAVLPDFVNASLLVFTLSAACTDIYCASRSLYGLARDKQAPAIFGKTLKNGNPIWATAVSSCSVALGFLNASKSSGTVFQYLVSLVTIFSVLNWFAILVSFLFFRRALKAQRITPSMLPYSSIGQPWGACYALFISCSVIMFSGYDAFMGHFQVDVFVLKYLGVALFMLNTVGWKVWKKTRMVKPDQTDLITGRREFQETEFPNEQQWNEGFWRKLLRKGRIGS
ncbi:dicarboxylic amino acid permease [Emericellopsis atlantica]|uniref:Dicarboxylic amino acid permease n=1 Tax=Emericellopsis atlantica TaxID=2614577 RepID=A0A9P7ZGS6_9HYPO|nr:dicarboxylic amino acid permease [Emericellopsis atlantica]KAG9251636.1 dicarboxylic amino acid permease [Emericellopsis atlantica]